MRLVQITRNWRDDYRVVVVAEQDIVESFLREGLFGWLIEVVEVVEAFSWVTSVWLLIEVVVVVGALSFRDCIC